MTGMNRLSPLIVRRTGPQLRARVAVGPVAHLDWDSDASEPDGASAWLEQLKLFATGWIGGLIFFGTYLG